MIPVCYKCNLIERQAPNVPPPISHYIYKKPKVNIRQPTCYHRVSSRRIQWVSAKSEKNSATKRSNRYGTNSRRLLAPKLPFAVA
ncbi:hypothetical protein LSH36_591g01043 [Paralvinella palmiformis]|uniref:Uncharacterized protein n=1 Tax=Paralvinella palmiformis TaxID=53620 RepID=A0AAD9J5R9_9ANNE|nr:hypothetical protein LSH36_591g01043 [Paralvinella palmiformis]